MYCSECDREEPAGTLFCPGCKKKMDFSKVPIANGHKNGLNMIVTLDNDGYSGRYGKDCTGTHVSSVRLGNNDHTSWLWLDAVLDVMYMMNDLHQDLGQDGFRQTLLSIKLGKKHQTIVFSASAQRLDRYDVSNIRTITGFGEPIYITTKFNANNLRELCYRIINAFGHNDKELRLKIVD